MISRMLVRMRSRSGILYSFLAISLLFIQVLVAGDKVNTESPLVHCETTKGPITIEVHESWAPIGARRFLDLIRDEFFTDIAFFRCVSRFLTQFGISDNPEKRHWHREQILDDPNIGMGIKRHYVSFAGGGPNTRSSQIFIAFEDLDFLGKEPWETAFGVVIDGQHTLDSLYKGYGDIPPFGEGPDQQEIFQQGNAYVRQLYPKIDFINSCHIISDKRQTTVRPAVGNAAPEDDASVIAGEGHELQPNELQQLDSVAAAANSVDSSAQSETGNRKKADNLDAFARAMGDDDKQKKDIVDDDRVRAFQQQLHKAVKDDIVEEESQRTGLRGGAAAAERSTALVYRAMAFLGVFLTLGACFFSFGKRSAKAQ